MLSNIVWKKAISETWESIAPRPKSNILFAIVTIVVATGIGIWIQGWNEAISNLYTTLLYGVSPVLVIAILRLLWNLWLAPYCLLEKSLGKLEAFVDSAPEGTPDPAIPANWKIVPILEMWRWAQVLAGVSPAGYYQKNDAGRAFHALLKAAIESGELKTKTRYESEPVDHRRIEKEELIRFLEKCGDVPEVLQ